MKNHSCSFLNRAVLSALAALLALILWPPAPALADVVTTFDVSGTAIPFAPVTGTTFSGAFQVDVTAGTVVSSTLDITFPGLPAFDTLLESHPSDTSDWLIVAENSSGIDLLTLDFTTGSTPGSLVGFTGGRITSGVVSVSSTGADLYVTTGGTITPKTVIPEPSSLVPLSVALACLAFALARRRFARSEPRPSGSGLPG
jgi:hypothetical protein